MIMKWKIACIQMDIAFGNPEENYQRIRYKIMLAAASKPDIVVLPELWTTGYDLTRLDELADHEADRTIRFLQECALAHSIHLVGGSVARSTPEGIFNTLIIVSNKGKVVKLYDKLHLFQLMNEHHFLMPGQNDGAFTLDEQHCAGFICYDIRFPEWLRVHSADGAGVLFIAAEWPEPRISHWRALLISRAIENQAYIIAVNRVGSDPANTFGGHSMVINPWGEIIAEAGDQEEIVLAEIDLELIDSVRKQIPVFQDRRPEFY